MQSGKSTAAANPNLTLKLYEKRVKEDVRVIYDSLGEILKSLKMDDDHGLSKMSQSDIDTYVFQIRTSNIIKANESLSKTVSDLKDLIILNDFKSINSQMTNQCTYFKQKEDEIDKTIRGVKDELITVVNELQHEYNNSNVR